MEIMEARRPTLNIKIKSGKHRRTKTERCDRGMNRRENTEGILIETKTKDQEPKHRMQN